MIFFANHTMTITSQRRVAEIVLLRVGNLSSTASADLATVDGTAYAGHSYIASKQRVVFAPNVATATFQVELLPMAKAISHSFFVAHVEAIHGRATMGSSSFIRIRLVPEGLWPPGAAVRLEGKRPRRRVERVRLVWRFGHLLLKRRGAKLWYVLASIIWLDFHKVVLNTLAAELRPLRLLPHPQQGGRALRASRPLLLGGLRGCVPPFAAHRIGEAGCLCAWTALQAM